MGVVCCTQKDKEVCSPLELMAKRNKGMHSDASTAHGRSFQPRATDVFICTYPKCGTTWVTQICHQIRSNGHMDFEEIFNVCPWDVMALDCGVDLNAEQVANPRVFKSHESFSLVAKGGKYIHVCRDPFDAFVSFYRFLPAWAAIPPGEITVEEFAAAVFGGVSHSGGIWDFYVDWWEQRLNPNVLWVCYEDLRSGLEEQVRRIAAFMEVPLDDALLQVTLEHSSFGFMQQRSTQFDEHVVFEKVRGNMGIPKDYIFGDVEVSKVRKEGGTTGEGKNLPDAVVEMLRKRWEITIEAKTGLKSYADLRSAVNSNFA
jgi:aryl sulfotransferase